VNLTHPILAGLTVAGASLAAWASTCPLTRHHRRRATAAAERVNWMPYLPPVPLPRDLQWYLDQPYEVRLTDTEVGLRLRDIEAAEGWAR